MADNFKILTPSIWQIYIVFVSVDMCKPKEKQ